MAFIYKIIMGSKTYVGKSERTDYRRILEHVKGAYGYRIKGKKGERVDYTASKMIREGSLCRMKVFTNENAADVFGLGKNAMNEFTKTGWHDLSKGQLMSYGTTKDMLNFAEICYISKNKSLLVNKAWGGEPMRAYFPPYLIDELERVLGSDRKKLLEIKKTSFRWFPQWPDEENRNRLYRPDIFILQKQTISEIPAYLNINNETWLKWYMSVLNKYLKNNSEKFAAYLAKGSGEDNLVTQMKKGLNAIIRPRLRRSFEDNLRLYSESFINTWTKNNYVLKMNFEDFLKKLQLEDSWIKNILRNIKQNVSNKILEATKEITGKRKKVEILNIKGDITKIETPSESPIQDLPRRLIEFSLKPGRELEEPKWLKEANPDLNKINNPADVEDDIIKWLIKDFQKLLKKIGKVKEEDKSLLESIRAAYRARGIALAENFNDFETFYHTMMGITFNSSRFGTMVPIITGTETVGLTREGIIAGKNNSPFKNVILIKADPEKNLSSGKLLSIMRINNEASIAKLKTIRY